jgi:predicted RNase H-like HicB family nuclease
MNAQTQSAVRYRVSLHRTRGCWFARVIDLPGCIARGASEVEAIENARAMIRAYLGVAQALAGEPASVVLEIAPF